MSKIDLSEKAFTTVAELRQLVNNVEAEIARRHDEKRAKFYEQAKQLAVELGIPVKELVEGPRKKTSRAKAGSNNAAAKSTETPSRRTTRTKDEQPSTSPVAASETS